MSGSEGYRPLDDGCEPGSSAMRKDCAGWSESWLSRLVEMNAGFLLVGAAQAFFAFMDLTVKLLNEIDPPVPTLELIDVRMGVTYLFCVAYMLWKKVPDPFLGPKGVRNLLAIRGFCGFTGLFGTYYSLRYLSLSDATALFFLAPLATAVVAYFFLGEPLRLREVLAGVISLIGVVLIAHPEALFGSEPGTKSYSEGTPVERLIAVSVALVGVLGASGAYTAIRAIGNRAHAMRAMSYFSLWCVIVSTIGIIVTRESIVIPTRLIWLALLILIGIFGFVAQMLLTLGFQRGAAGRSAMAIYVQMIFAIALERIFFRTVPSILSVTGIAIIMGSAIFVALTKQTKETSMAAIDGTDNESNPGIEDEAQSSETRRLLSATERNTCYESIPDTRAC
ncbi:hypothetical protein ACEPAF_1973 [Sanghuangporus sanghuang]